MVNFQPLIALVEASLGANLVALLAVDAHFRVPVQFGTPAMVQGGTAPKGWEGVPFEDDLGVIHRGAGRIRGRVRDRVAVLAVAAGSGVAEQVARRERPTVLEDRADDEAVHGVLALAPGGGVSLRARKRRLNCATESRVSLAMSARLGRSDGSSLSRSIRRNIAVSGSRRRGV